MKDSMFMKIFEMSGNRRATREEFDALPNVYEAPAKPKRFVFNNASPKASTQNDVASVMKKLEEIGVLQASSFGSTTKSKPAAPKVTSKPSTEDQVAAVMKVLHEKGLYTAPSSTPKFSNFSFNPWSWMLTTKYHPKSLEMQMIEKKYRAA